MARHKRTYTLTSTSYVPRYIPSICKRERPRPSTAMSMYRFGSDRDFIHKLLLKKCVTLKKGATNTKQQTKYL